MSQQRPFALAGLVRRDGSASCLALTPGTLSVLIGRNGCGKTYLLESVDAALKPGVGRRRVDRVRPDESADADLGLLLSLDEAAWFESVIDDGSWSIDDLAEYPHFCYLPCSGVEHYLRADVTLSDVVEIVAKELAKVATASAGKLDYNSALVGIWSRLVGSVCVAVSPIDRGISLYVTPDGSGAPLAGLQDRVDLAAETVDALSDLFSRWVSFGHIADLWLADGARSWLFDIADTWRVEVVGVEPVDIDAILEERLGRLAPSGAVDLCRHRLGGHLPRLQDPWFAPEGAPGIVDEWITTAARRIEAEANSHLPTFVADEGSVVVEVLHPRDWTSGEPRVSARFRFRNPPSTHAPEPVAINMLGAGHRRWAATAIIEAAGRLADPSKPVIYLVDEPELHLHPTAVQDAISWIQHIAGAEGTALLATHSPIVLDAPDLSVYRMVRSPANTTLVELSTSLLEDLRQLAPELGLRSSDWLMSVRGVLAVEGEHDLRVLHQFFRTSLADARVVPVALRGSKNVTALAELGLLHKLGLPVRVILDNVRAAKLEEAASAGLTDEEIQVRRFDKLVRSLATERSYGLDLVSIPYDDPDVICALPEPAVKRAYPDATFTTWTDIITDYRTSTARTRFKEFAFKRMNLDRSVTADHFLDRVLLHSAATDEPTEPFARAVTEALARIEQPRMPTLRD